MIWSDKQKVLNRFSKKFGRRDSYDSIMHYWSSWLLRIFGSRDHQGYLLVKSARIHMIYHKKRSNESKMKNNRNKRSPGRCKNVFPGDFFTFFSDFCKISGLISLSVYALSGTSSLKSRVVAGVVLGGIWDSIMW